MTRDKPPAFPCWFLESVLSAPNRSAIVGDLLEEYAERVQSTSPAAASAWLWGQACRSIPSMVASSLRSADWLLCLTVATATFFGATLFMLAADLLVSRWLGASPRMHIVATPFEFLAAVAGAGIVAGRIRAGATLHLALLVTITIAVVRVFKLCTAPAPWWYPLPFLIVGPLAALLVPAAVKSSRGG